MMPAVNYVLMLFGVVMLSDLFVCWKAWKIRQKAGKWLGAVMTAAIFATYFYMLSIVSSNYFWNSFFNSVYTVGVDLILVTMLGFAESISKVDVKNPVFRAINIFAILFLLADGAMMMINPFQEVVISFKPVMAFGIMIYQYIHLPLYRVHLVLSYIMVWLIMIILLRRAYHTTRLYKEKYHLIAIIFMLEVVMNACFVMWAGIFKLDIAVLAYSISGLLIYVIVFRLFPSTLLSMTRNYVVDTIDWPMVVFDDDHMIIDMNKNARELFMDGRNDDLADLEYDEEKFRSDSGLPEMKEGVFEWTAPNGLRYECEYHSFRDSDEKECGYMLLLRDMIYKKDTATGLDGEYALYRYLSNALTDANLPIQLILVNVNNLSLINNVYGREQGDEAMRRTVTLMKEVFHQDTYMVKGEDGSIVAVLLKEDKKDVEMKADRLSRMIRIDKLLNFQFTIEYGISSVQSTKDVLTEVIHEASVSMKNKKMLTSASQESALINSMRQVLFESDFETEEHVERTRINSERIAKVMQLSDKETSELALLCLMHDIGKVAIPIQILSKPDKLNDEEWKIMKTHTSIGYRIAMASEQLKPIAECILHHHERWDGKGYPDGLKGEEIPLLSRIITVLDSYDVMTHDRPYHKAISKEEALEELKRCSGTQFDPNIVDIFMKIFS